MKRPTLSILLVALGALLVGCGEEQAPGYDSASREAAEALAKANNDISKLTPEQRAALEKAANRTRPDGGAMVSTNGGTGAPAPSGTTGG
ncbi:MAG: hypothetical protein ACO1SV_08530 [Fimbriimonas sp.]